MSVAVSAPLAGVDALLATANLKPDVPGLVHGIVGLDPVEIQCDGCGRIDSGKKIGTTIVLSRICFAFREYAAGDHRRMCLDCRKAAGWRLGVNER